MMKVLLDTNVVLDAIAERQPWQDDAQRIVLLAAEEKVEGFITANCLTDIYYIFRKSLSDTDAREALRSLFQVFGVIDLRGADCEAALDLPMADYEDAVATVCASKTGVEYIVTRDEEFLKAAPHPIAISPHDFLEKFQRNQM